MCTCTIFERPRSSLGGRGREREFQPATETLLHILMPATQARSGRERGKVFGNHCRCPLAFHPGKAFASLEMRPHRPVLRFLSLVLVGMNDQLFLMKGTPPDFAGLGVVRLCA